MADVQGVIRERIAEIESEKRRLEAALAELTGERRNRRRAKPRAASRRVTPAKAARAKPGERRKQVLGHLEKNSGARASEIAEAIGASAKQVHGVIAKLRAEKLIRKRGKGYGLARGAQSVKSS